MIRSVMVMRYLAMKYTILLVAAVLLLGAAYVKAEMTRPQVTGRIVKVSGDIIFIDAGVDKGVKPGDRFEILQQRSDGRVEKAGVLAVNQVFEKSSVGMPVTLLPGRIPGVNDMLFEYRDVAYPQYPEPGHDRTVIRSKWIRASEDNLNVIIGAEIESGAGIHSAYCVYRYEGSPEWRGMALTKEYDDASVYRGLIPGPELMEGTLEYYLIAVDARDRITYSGGRENPHRAAVLLARPFIANEAESGRMLDDGNTRGGISPWIIIPGISQLKNGEMIKGISLLALETAALAAGVAAGSEKAIYYGAAGLVYVFNMADVLVGR